LSRVAPTLLVAAVLVATATAFAVTERWKLDESPVLGTRMPRIFSPKLVEARIGFRLRDRENLTLDIADSSGRIVRHGIGTGVFGQAFHEFAWDGRDDEGRIVPDGVYRAELTLLDESRTIEFPNEVVVDTTPPTIEDVTLRHQVFSPDGDGRADRVDFRYRFSEPAFAILYVDGKRNNRSYGKKPIGTIQWYGKGRKPGNYRLALAAQDRAGNMAASTREFNVHLRFVELFRRRYVARGPTLRLRISTDAKRVHWRLGGRSGTHKPRRLTIPVPTVPGRYVLTVTANGHPAKAIVVVRRPDR
jgi:FlgD Ig-like domain